MSRCGLALRELVLASMFAAVAALPRARAAEVDLDIALDPVARTLSGTATLRFAEAEPPVFLLASDAVIERVTARGRPAQLERTERDGRAVFHLPAATKARDVTIAYRLELAPLDIARDHRGVLGGMPAMADARGSFLPAGTAWHPAPEGDFTYTVAVSVPGAQRAVAPGRLASESEAGGVYRARFEFSHPSSGIDLMAGPYVVRERHVSIGGRELRLRTYFGADLGDALSDDYLAAVERYLRLYSDWIGEYPFAGFSVVASPLPTGFGMPTLTYLGAQVIRLPFIRDTSLGHEVLHNWWGNGVYPDYAQGNWAEGLDDVHGRLRVQGTGGRRGGAGDAPRLAPRLRGTARRRGQATCGIYLAHAQRIGRRSATARRRWSSTWCARRSAPRRSIEAIRAFYRDYRFRQASWADLEAAFAKASGQSLGPLLDPWLTRTGAPRISIPSAVAEPAGSDWDLYVLLAQDPPPYPLDVPVAIRSGNAAKTVRVPLTTSRDAATLTLQSRPDAVAVDPDFQLWRALAPAESPPILREVIAARDPVLVSIEGSRDFVNAAETLSQALLERPARRAETLPGDATVAILVGTHGHIATALAKYRLGAPPEEAKGRGTAQAWTVRRANQTVLVISARDADSLAALARALPHLGGQSWAVFEGPRPVARGVWQAEAVSVPVRLTGGK